MKINFQSQYFVLRLVSLSNILIGGSTYGKTGSNKLFLTIILQYFIDINKYFKLALCICILHFSPEMCNRRY